MSETRQRFIDGTLHPATLLMCPHSCVINLPKPREQQSDIGPAAMFVGNIVQGMRIAGAKGRDIGPDDDKVYRCFFSILNKYSKVFKFIDTI